MGPHSKWACCWDNVPTNLPADFPRDLTYEEHRPHFVDSLRHSIVMRTCGAIRPTSTKCVTCDEMRAASDKITSELIRAGNPPWAQGAKDQPLPSVDPATSSLTPEAHG